MVHGNVETVVCYDNHQAGPWHRWHTFLMQQSCCYFKPSLIVVLISKRIFHEQQVVYTLHNISTCQETKSWKILE